MLRPPVVLPFVDTVVGVPGWLIAERGAGLGEKSFSV